VFVNARQIRRIYCINFWK